MSEPLTALVPIPLLEELLARALAAGGDFAEVYVERSQSQSVVLEEHQIRTATHAAGLGVGIRVIKGTEVGYAYSDDLEAAALRETAQVAGAIARAGGGAKPVALRRRARPDRYPVELAPDAVPPRDKVELLLRGDQAGHQADRRVIQVLGSFADSRKEILIATSDGTLVDDLQVMSRLNFTVITDDGRGDRRTGFHGGGGRVPFTHFTTTLTPEAAAREAARMALAQLGAVAAPAGPQVVVLSPGWSGVLLHEAVGHGLEADFIRKGTSLFAGKLGERVASELVTVIDNGELLHRRGSVNVDDEGVVAGEKVLIENGVLRGYLVDRLSAQVMGIGSTGSGRRESYQHAPMPRMTNTYMAGGATPAAEIVASVEKGLYCATLGGGQVDISNGNFVFEVREGYLIERGKLGPPVRNATLIGVGPEALRRVTMVGDDPQLDPGIGSCGKDGQTVPVGVGLPTVRLDGITVGGTDAG